MPDGRRFVKICGVTRVEDAVAAADAGADAIGLNFYPLSPRYLTTERAKEISRNTPEGVLKFGVCVNESADFLKRTFEECELDYLQLHGQEEPEFVKGLALPVLKSFAVHDEQVLLALKEYGLEWFLLDTWSKVLPGGTGLSFNWDIARRAGALGRVVLSGGLRPDNVAKAIAACNPYGVDVATGVESEPGVKDKELIRSFVQEVREWDYQTG